MRLVYILTSMGIGGAERQVVALAESMRARGHVVMILVLLPSVPCHWPTSVSLIHLNLRKTPWSAIAGFIRAARVVGKFKPDILHSHNFHGNLLGRLLKSVLRGTPVISSIHNVYEGGRLRMLAYRLSDRLSRCTVAVCGAAANRMVKLGAVPRRKCSVIANGIDTREFLPQAARRNWVREQMAARDEFIWIAVGRVVPAKNYENMLRAFAWVLQAQGDAKLWIAGDANGIYAEEMQTLAGELELSRSLRWLGMRRDLGALFDAADGFVMSSAWEGMPLALGEAMAMEKPVVATDVGGVRELAGDCGIIVLAGNASSLAQGMLQTMREPQAARQRIGQAARCRITENFSMKSKADDWEAQYLAVQMHS